MARTAEAPPAAAKVGLKIDYLARAHLAPFLKKLGFRARGRTLWQAGGEGVGAWAQIINLQAYKYNEGSKGAFYVNLAIMFPALLRHQARVPDLAWMAPQADKIDEANGHLRARLEDMLPQPAELLTEGKLQMASAESIDKGNILIATHADLDELGRALTGLIERHAWPVLQADADLARFEAGAWHEGWFAFPLQWQDRITAALLLGGVARAQARYDELAPTMRENAVLAHSEAEWATHMGLRMPPATP